MHYLLMGPPRPLSSFMFVFSNKQFLQQLFVKNVDPVYGAGLISNPQPSEHEFTSVTTRPPFNAQNFD